MMRFQIIYVVFAVAIILLFVPTTVVANESDSYFNNHPIKKFKKYPIQTYSKNGRREEKLSKKDLHKIISKITVKGLINRKNFVLIELPPSEKNGPYSLYFIKNSDVVPRNQAIWNTKIGQSSKDFVCFRSKKRMASIRITQARNTNSAAVKGLANIDC